MKNKIRKCSCPCSRCLPTLVVLQEMTVIRLVGLESKKTKEVEKKMEKAARSSSCLVQGGI